MLSIERLDLATCDWERMDAFADRVVFQTREWLEFVARTQRAEPVVAAVLSGGEAVGFFTGLIIRRFGVRVLGSPFPGWTTASMGFNLEPGVSRGEAAQALVPFAFGRLRCQHLELTDRLLDAGDLDRLGFRCTPKVGLEVDLRGSEDEIFGRMTSACRRAIRRAAKVGVRVEEAAGEEFADEYHDQLVEVFARQGLEPSYDAERVRALIACLHPTGRLLLLRAVGPDGTRIATGIFPAMNATAYFWGGASRREHQIHRPNEAIFWHAMRHWRSRGIAALDMGGGGDYKLRYGPRRFELPSFYRSRLPGLSRLRDVAWYVKARHYA